MNKNKIYSIKTCLKTKTHIQNSLLILQIHVHIKDKIKHTRGDHKGRGIGGAGFSEKMKYK